jgi:hypothetical protein
MARATYGGIITNLKGSIGGLTFQKNVSGAIVRLRPWRKKFNSLKQQIAQQIFYQKNMGWHQLSLGDQQLWNAFAKLHTFTDPFGDLETLTGHQWYISINTNLEIISQPHITQPPAWTLPTSPPTATLFLSTSGIYLQVASPAPAGYDAIVISLTAPISNSSFKVNGRFRQVFVKPAGGWTNQVLTTYWETYFGLIWTTLTLTGSFKIACEIFCIDTASGLTSPVNRYIATFTAGPSGIGAMIIESDFIIS